MTSDKCLWRHCNKGSLLSYPWFSYLSPVIGMEGPFVSKGHRIWIPWEEGATIGKYSIHNLIGCLFPIGTQLIMTSDKGLFCLCNKGSLYSYAWFSYLRPRISMEYLYCSKGHGNLLPWEECTTIVTGWSFSIHNLIGWLFPIGTQLIMTSDKGLFCLCNKGSLYSYAWFSYLRPLIGMEYLYCSNGHGFWIPWEEDTTIGNIRFVN